MEAKIETKLSFTVKVELTENEVRALDALAIKEIEEAKKRLKF